MQENQQNQQNQQTPPKKHGSTIWYIVGIIAIVLVIMLSMNSCSSGAPRGTYNQFITDIGNITVPTGNSTEYTFRQVPYTIGDVSQAYPTATDTLLMPANDIEAIVRQGNTFYVLLWNSSNETDIVSKFQSKPSSYATYYVLSQYDEISNIITAYQSWITNMYNSLKTGTDYTGINPEADKNDSNKMMYYNYVNSFTENGIYVILYDQQPVPSSWFNFSDILYAISIIVLIIIGFIIFRSFSSRNGLGNMGRNRATHTFGGTVKFTDVAGIDEEKEEVQEIVQFLKNPRKFLELGARIPKGVLLVGEPGTGKTLLAKAIAGEAGVHFFSISGSDFSEMLVGVGPSRMRDLFETAKLNAPAIIFIDEIDSIARMRGVGVSGVSDENEQTLNQLLVQMDGFTKSEGVIVLAATNRPDVLDQALLRPGRFDRQIIIQMPDVKGREQILMVHAKNKPIGDDVDLKRVAQIISGFSGADIENLLNESAIIAAKKDKKKIGMADITEGINKVLLGPQKRSRIITEEDKKITAYHEAGHAIVSRILQPDQTVQEVSIIPRGMAAGYTLTNEKDIESHHKSRKFLVAQLAMLMAGRVAEQLFIGDTCTGASNDLKVATDLAERMVTMFGMSEKLGPMYYGKEEEVALRLYNAQNPHSESLQSLIDGEVKSFILNAEKTASDILKDNKSKADTMAQILLERETIYAADINLIMEGKSSKSIIAEMEKRAQHAREQERADKIEATLDMLNRDLDNIMKHSQRFVDAKLADPAKLDKLEANMELARQVVRDGKDLTHLPTLDNLEDYATLIQQSDVQPEQTIEPQPEKPVKTKKTKTEKKKSE